MRSRLALAAALLAISLPGGADAVLPIDLTTGANLGFGKVVATATAGTVTVAPSGSRSAAGGVALGNAMGASPASFTVTGEPNTAYSITLPSAVALSAGASSMTADGFTSTPSGEGNLGPSGTQTIAVGATLHVGAQQSPAFYSGTYLVVVSYN